MKTLIIIIHIFVIYQLRLAFKWKRSGKNYAGDPWYDYFVEEANRIPLAIFMVMFFTAYVILFIYLLVTYLP